MDVHVALGEEMERLFQEWNTASVEEGDAIGARLSNITTAVVSIPARSLVGAVLQLREIVRSLHDDDISGDTKERLYDAALSALEVVEAVAGVDRSAYAGNEFVPRNMH